MHIVHPRVRDQPVAARAKLPAEVHVLAGFERRVESADRLECRAADGHVPAAEPVDGFLPAGMTPQPIVQPLNPGRRRWRAARRADRSHAIVRQDAHGRRDPVGTDFVVGVDER